MSEDDQKTQADNMDIEMSEASEDTTGAEGETSAGAASSGMKLEDMNTAEQTDDEDDFPLGEPMAKDVEAIYDIPVQISAVLGRSTMQVSQLLKLGRGAVVELDRKVGEAIDIYVNNRLVARGEVVVVEDKLGVTMTEIVKSDRS